MDNFGSSLFSGGVRRSQQDSSVTYHTPPELTFTDPLSSERDRAWQQALVAFVAQAEHRLESLREVVSTPDPRSAVSEAVTLVRAAAELLDRVDTASSSVASVTACRLAIEQFLVSADAAARIGRRPWPLRWLREEDTRARWAACGPILWSTPLVLEQVFAVAGTAFESESAKILWLNLFGTFLRELKSALKGVTGRW